MALSLALSLALPFCVVSTLHPSPFLAPYGRNDGIVKKREEDRKQRAARLAETAKMPKRMERAAVVRQAKTQNELLDAPEQKPQRSQRSQENAESAIGPGEEVSGVASELAGQGGSKGTKGTKGGKGGSSQDQGEWEARTKAHQRSRERQEAKMRIFKVRQGVFRTRAVLNQAESDLVCENDPASGPSRPKVAVELVARIAKLGAALLEAEAELARLEEDGKDLLQKDMVRRAKQVSMQHAQQAKLAFSFTGPERAAADQAKQVGSSRVAVTL